MNTDKLKELVDKIQEVESRVSTQAKLQQLSSSISQIVNQPQNPDFQNAMANSLKEFATSMQQFQSAFTPRDYLRVRQMSEDAFSLDIPDTIEQAIRENPMSPNIVNGMVQNLHSTRNDVFTNLEQLDTSLEYFDFGYVEAKAGTAEVGFQIPRDLFDNNLDGLIEELKQIKNMIRFFSEATLGEYHPATVGSISTTDPLIFLAMAEEVAKNFGLVVTWGIGVWYSVEQIRKVRAETAKLQSFSKNEIEKFFDTKIQQEIDSAVAKKVSEIIEQGKATKGKKGELTGQLTWVLESLLAKMERGLTIELRVSPPPEDEDEDTESANGETTRQQLVEIQKQLVFPEPSENPVLTIPEMKNNKD